MCYAIDRFEEGIAVCEDETGLRRLLPRSLLPTGAAEGDLLREVDGHWTVDAQATAARRAALSAKRRRLMD